MLDSRCVPRLIARFADFRLIDLPGLLDCLPLSTAELTRHVQKSSQEGARFLENVWVPACVEIISQRRDEVEAWMPGDEVRVGG